MKKIYINNYLPLILVLIVILCILILISVVYSTHNNCHYCALAEAFSHKTVFVEDYFNKYKMSIDYIQLMDSKIVFHFLPLPALLLLVFPGNYFLGLNILSIIFILSSIILTYCLIKHFTNNNFFIYILPPIFQDKQKDSKQKPFFPYCFHISGIDNNPSFVLCP